MCAFKEVTNDNEIVACATSDDIASKNKFRTLRGAKRVIFSVRV